jgi:hypothetical protein
MASTMGFSLLFALFLVTAVAARQAPSGEEKAYAPPYGSDPTPSGSSPVVPTPTPPTTPTDPTPTPTPTTPTPTTPTDPTPITPTDPVPTTPDTPYTPPTPTPSTPSDPAPVTPADPVPTTPTTPYTPDPAPITPADPIPTPTTPYTPDPTPITPADPVPATPAASTPGTCTWWSSHTTSFPDIISIVSTIADLFGTITGGSGSSGTGVTSTIASIFGGQLTVMQSLTNTRNDGFGALARQGSAALLNSLTRRDYPYNAFQVKTQFRNSLQSQQQAFATAKLFENANIALGAGRH